MKKILILPSTTGQGDLAVSAALSKSLDPFFEVSTAYFPDNSHSPLLRELRGKTICFEASSQPDHSKPYETQLRNLSSEIQEHGANIVIALNESYYALSAFMAGRPVIQLTHLLNNTLIDCGKWMLRKSLRRSAVLPNSLQEFANSISLDSSTAMQFINQLASVQRPGRAIRALRKLRHQISPLKRSRLRIELVSRYGQLIGTTYLSQLVSDSVIVHSINELPNDYFKTINKDRAAFHRAPVLVASSVPPNQARVSETPKVVLLTFGGIDHPITPGMLRLLKLLNETTSKFVNHALELHIAGRVTETKRSFFEETFATNPLRKSGRIKLIGSIDHEDHLKLIERADLILTQPGYATICELVASNKPFVLFYGIAPYYEQAVNFTTATSAGISVNLTKMPPLQVGEFGTFGTRRAIKEHRMAEHLLLVFSRLVAGELTKSVVDKPITTTPHFTEVVKSELKRLGERLDRSVAPRFSEAVAIL